ncbi:DNA integrity scanning protein DisA nucleotide-binding domain protein [Bacillus cereus]|uniref:DNA integrity scanning protein DisA nucleotide-binding domain protein n=1 Tax=Bacillus cereus TaxID=1396 RepID=UPI001F0A3740|nr:diadenylate cyclase [Bacillus cereus]
MNPSFPLPLKEELLWALVEAAKKQKHGTLLAILERAEGEAERLATQCIKVYPIELSDEIMELVSSIDGAVLVYLEANIHAMGVILDGAVSKKGDASRGARYNSACRYVEMYEHKCILVVVSEDKDIELVYD